MQGGFTGRQRQAENGAVGLLVQGSERNKPCERQTLDRRCKPLERRAEKSRGELGEGCVEGRRAG